MLTQYLICVPQSTQITHLPNAQSPSDIQTTGPSCATVSDFRQQPESPKSVMVNPPEAELEISSGFSVKHPGVRKCPLPGSVTIYYFYLFLTNEI